MRIGALWGLVLVLAGTACGSSPLCENGTAAGTVWLKSDDDLRAMVGCTHVKGHLIVDSLPSASLAGLESLTTVDGKLIIGPNAALNDISALASLASVGGGNIQGGSEMNVAGNPMLATARFPALTSVAGQLSLGDAGLTTIDFPALTSLPGGLLVSGTTTLTSLAGLETVTSLGKLSLVGNAALTDTSGLAGLIEIAADLMVQENAGLTTLRFPLLASVGATGPSPGSIGPSTRQFYVANNPALTRIDVPSLTFVGPGGVRIYNNAALPDCQAGAVANKVSMPCDCGGNGSAGGNCN